MPCLYSRIYRPEHPRATPQGLVMVHVLVAERALGVFIDRKHPIHHFNENPTDNRNQNLVICEDAKYHKLLHVRVRVLRAGGNPNTEKLCTKCKSLHFKTDFCKERGKYDGLSQICNQCRAKKQIEWRSRNHDKVLGYLLKQRPYLLEWKRKDKATRKAERHNGNENSSV